MMERLRRTDTRVSKVGAEVMPAKAETPSSRHMKMMMAGNDATCSEKRAVNLLGVRDQEIASSNIAGGTCARSCS